MTRLFPRREPIAHSQKAVEVVDIGSRLKIVGLVEYLDEDANNDIYDFDSLLLSIGLDYMF